MLRKHFQILHKKFNKWYLVWFILFQIKVKQSDHWLTLKTNQNTMRKYLYLRTNHGKTFQKIVDRLQQAAYSPNLAIVGCLSNLFKLMDISIYCMAAIFIIMVHIIYISSTFTSTSLKWKIHIQSIWLVVVGSIYIKANITNYTRFEHDSSASFLFDLADNWLPKVVFWISEVPSGSMLTCNEERNIKLRLNWIQKAVPDYVFIQFVRNKNGSIDRFNLAGNIYLRMVFYFSLYFSFTHTLWFFESWFS